jgi:murein DD-endopeptidase MepM/ murein hydrolase activator NlpD
LDKLSVKEGDKVESGDLIGLMGSTGNSTGPHLHFSVLKNGEYIDPVPVTTIRSNGK